MTIQHLLNFTELTTKFQKITRTVLINGEDRWENDLEHTAQLGLVCWYLCECMKKEYDLEKILKYSLIHDIVETYAGDTYAHETDLNVVNSKESRELAALHKIQSDFPDFDVTTIWSEYETSANEEAKFVKAVDKLIPVINIYMDGARSWHIHKVTMKMIREVKDKKISELNSDIHKLYLELYEIIERDMVKLGIEET